MIINGKSRANGAQLAEYLVRDSESGLNAYLQRMGTNEEVELLEILGMATDDPAQALYEMQEIAEGGQDGVKGLYHANINPEKAYDLSRADYIRCVDVLEDELGFTGQPRLVYKHRKKGRTHLHVVWQRTDVRTLKLRRDSFDYAAHERAARRLELELGHCLIQGRHVDAQARHLVRPPPRTLDDHREACTAAWTMADSPAAFVSALAEQGYILARGDRRGYVAVDPDGQAVSLSRALGITTGQIRRRLRELPRPSLTEAIEMAKERKAQAQQAAFDAAARPARAQPPAAAKSAAAAPDARRVYPEHWGFEKYEAMGREQRDLAESVRDTFATRPRPVARHYAARIRRWTEEMISIGNLPSRQMIMEKRAQDRAARHGADKGLQRPFEAAAGPALPPDEIAAQRAARDRERRLEAERAILASIREDGARRFQEMGRAQQARRTAVMQQHGAAEHWRTLTQKNLLSQQDQQTRSLTARQSAERNRGLSWLIGALTGANARQNHRHAEERRQMLFDQQEARTALQQKSGEERAAQSQELRALDHAELQETTRLEVELTAQLRALGWDGPDPQRGVDQIRHYAETATLPPVHAQALAAHYAPDRGMSLG
jgi:hypothetical protein